MNGEVANTVEKILASQRDDENRAKLRTLARILNEDKSGSAPHVVSILSRHYGWPLAYTCAAHGTERVFLMLDNENVHIPHVARMCANDVALFSPVDVMNNIAVLAKAGKNLPEVWEYWLNYVGMCREAGMHFETYVNQFKVDLDLALGLNAEMMKNLKRSPLLKTSKFY